MAAFGSSSSTIAGHSIYHAHPDSCSRVGNVKARFTMRRISNPTSCSIWVDNNAKSSGISVRGSVASASKASVVVTRELGKNEKLIRALSDCGIVCMELPLIEHRDGPDMHRLAGTICENNYDWIVITSPEAALVFIDGWRAAACPKVRIAVVGQGTAQLFHEIIEGKEKLDLAFIPSRATAKDLAAELPRLSDGIDQVLYPASAKASHDLEIGLSERGFKVTRLNTYSTESVKSLDEAKIKAARSTLVATFASPTAVKAWVELIGPWNGASACIGSTSAQAAKKAGLQKVFFPESPGIDGWVESILCALKSRDESPSSM